MSCEIYSHINFQRRLLIQFHFIFLHSPTSLQRSEIYTLNIFHTHTKHTEKIRFGENGKSKSITHNTEMVKVEFRRWKYDRNWMPPGVDDADLSNFFSRYILRPLRFTFASMIKRIFIYVYLAEDSLMLCWDWRMNFRHFCVLCVVEDVDFIHIIDGRLQALMNGIRYALRMDVG